MVVAGGDISRARGVVLTLPPVATAVAVAAVRVVVDTVEVEKERNKPQKHQKRLNYSSYYTIVVASIGFVTAVVTTVHRTNQKA